jgi:hypothetical protein
VSAARAIPESPLEVVALGRFPPGKSKRSRTPARIITAMSTRLAGSRILIFCFIRGNMLI